MRILPVLDLKQGKVVRGIAGRRHEYRPIVSRLTPSCEPLEVARAFRTHFGLSELYLADLDAIRGAPPVLPVYAALRGDGFHLWVDAGIREAADALALAQAELEGIVLGLETVSGPDTLEELCRKLGEKRLIFSLDLRGGQPLTNSSRWTAADAWSIAVQAVTCGVRRLIVLDLARVGVNEGPGTEELCGRLVRAFPEVEVTAGGGVRDVTDLQRLRDRGVSAVLVASALHDGRLRRADLEVL
jgi:phosphoribosylformimino-5-aminoimidazole carboxamide ribotide isomerase